MAALNRIEITGKHNTAICYAKELQDRAREQIQRMCDYELTAGSKIRIMPDVHAGKGCTIGTTMTIIDKAVPNIVGVDIGCGMYTVNLGKVDIDYKRFDEAAHFVPSAQDVWDKVQEEFAIEELRCFPELKNTGRLKRSMGTLGGGNHFIEIDTSADGIKYLVIHTGSRNLGKQVANIYQQIAIDCHKGIGNYRKTREALIKDYRTTGRDKEIQAALKQLSQDRRTRVAALPEDICYLEGEELEDYLHDIEICQRFAIRNRENIARILLERTGLVGKDGFHTIHNYIDTKERILRKGAIAAYKDELVLIPMNMRDGCILAKGRGNPDWNYSGPHGAGRAMSRTQARRSISIAEFRAVMENVYTTSINEVTLDEAPMAYKALEDIIDVIKDTVDVIEVLKPVYNFKAAEERLW